ncbi:MAG: phosphatase PAP2 family protein [Bacteroidaceae bacterium]|nr:phosphatase PAP2 family protein [Bacteroidaceae bacterium]
MTNKHILIGAKVMSMLFTPFYLPIVGLMVLFLFSYLSLLPWAYKCQVALLVYIFTVLAPTLLIRLYRHAQGWTHIEMLRRQHRIVPYIITIVLYFVCYYILRALHAPHFITSILIAALLIQILCALINVWWKISTHTAAVGAFAGGLIAFAFRLQFNPTTWLAITLIVAGLVGCSRIILRQHSLTQVVAGFFLGMICAYSVC